MKKNKTSASILFLILSAITLHAQEREVKPVSLEKQTDHIFQILDGRGSNGGVIIGENAVLIVDAKMDKESVDQTIEAVWELADKPIKYLVNTHSDGDHIMGNRYFPETITVVAHENCRDDFFKENFGRESDWDQPEFYPFTPSITFNNRLDLWLGTDKVELHYFGVGHTTGDVVVYCPKDKVAFVGDQYFSSRPQLIHSNKNGNSFDYVKTVSRMLETLDAETFLSGHSDPVGRTEIEKHVQLMVERQSKVKGLVDQDLSLEATLENFEEDEARLVSSIYNEIKGGKWEQPKANPY